MASRRTHIVRVHAPPISPPDGSTPPYVDIEVLDAISFKTTNGGIMVLNMPTKGITPYIKDNTGGGNGKSPALPTRASHMTRIEGTIPGSAPGTGDFKFDVECIDAIGCKGPDGKVWILNMPETDSTAYCTTDGTGDASSTRQTHLEVLYADGGIAGSGSSITIERVDYLGFKSRNGETMIIANPSSDDGSGSGRANTYMTPPDYDPTNPSSVPPNIEDNGDPNLYFKFVPQKIPSQSITIVTAIITLMFHGHFSDYLRAPATSLPTATGYSFIPDPGQSGSGWGQVAYPLFYGGTDAVGYANSLIGQPFFQTGPLIQSVIVTVLTSTTSPPTPPILTSYQIATQNDNSPPTAGNPNNIKMGALWWIRKWGQAGGGGGVPQ